MLMAKVNYSAVINANTGNQISTPFTLQFHIYLFTSNIKVTNAITHTVNPHPAWGVRSSKAAW
jgi:hypothetical protein